MAVFPFAVLLSTVSVIHGQLRPEDIKWKILDISGS